MNSPLPTRRTFLNSSVAFAASMPLLAQSLASQSPALTDKSTINIIGPKPGYTPQIGTLASMLTWVQRAVIMPTQKLTQADLDHLLDKDANSIGALMLHLAATETYYQRHTFNGEPWGKWPADISAKWDAAMNLGDAGRKTIKGHVKVTDVSFLSREMVRSTFFEDFRAFMKSQVPDDRLEFDWKDTKHDPTGNILSIAA